MLPWLFLLSLMTGLEASDSFLEIPPVKLLSAELIANRFPAADNCSRSRRTRIENGYDENATRTDIEELNDYPSLRMILNPGGCAYYEFDEVKFDEFNMFITPAMKEGENGHESWCDKAHVKVFVNSNGTESENPLMFKCFDNENDPDYDPCSSASCTHNVSNIFPKNNEYDVPLDVTICHESENYPFQEAKASLWEIKFSRKNDTSAAEGVFEEEARNRISDIKDIDEFNTQLSIISMVGERGAGKSTIASLLSGNSSMFQTGHSSDGTTTEGADISSTFPSIDWTNNLNKKIEGNITIPEKNYPLLFIDSEGMGVRGSEFDFITTSPPAIIAKMIVFLSSGPFVTDKLLQSINNYMNGLDNIVFDGDSSTTVGVELCNKRNYGKFIAVQNKMPGEATDDKLYKDLYTEEPEEIIGAKVRNRIRRKIHSCFDEYDVVGIPYLDPFREPVDYDLLFEQQSDRFQRSLEKLGNWTVDKLSTPRDVTVAGEERELNAANAESIISTVISEANKGVIDLNGFDSFWEMTKSEIEIYLRDQAEELEFLSENCNQLTTGHGFECTACVCKYRNQYIENVKDYVDVILDIATVDAAKRFNIDLESYVAIFQVEVLDPWYTDTSCSNGELIIEPTENICDTSINTLNIATIRCQMLFMCGNEIPIQVPLSGSSIAIFTESIWIDRHTTIKNISIARANDGKPGSEVGEKGNDGANGIHFPNLEITANTLIYGSDNEILYTTKGQDGGNGGNGAKGKANTDPPHGTVPTPKEVCVRGERYERHNHHYYHNDDVNCDTFWERMTTCYDEYSEDYYRWIDYEDHCGFEGAEGGNGGTGGNPGTLTIFGDAQNYLEPKYPENPIESIDGQKGEKGPIGDGIHFTLTYEALHEWHRHAHCGFWFWDQYCRDWENINYDTYEPVSEHIDSTKLIC